MKIIFMGTPAIAVPCLETLIQNGFDVCLAVTQPDRPKGRGHKEQFSPVKECAIANGIEVYQPEKLKNNEEAFNKLSSYEADFFCVAAYGRILPQNVLDIPKKAPVNVHFSLLPMYRGAAPVNWAIVNGNEITGVSTMLMDAGMDTGDILLRREIPILRKNAEELGNELAKEGAALLFKTLKNFDIITPLKQDSQKVSLAPIMKKEDGLIDWAEPAEYIERKIRGFYPWPAAYSHLNGKMVKFFAAETEELKYKEKPGAVCAADKNSFSIACGKGALVIKELQIEGKKRMDVKSFLAGFTIEQGAIFG